MSRSDLMLLLALALVFVPLERWRPIRRVAPDWRRLTTDIFHVFLSGTLIALGIGAVRALLAMQVRPLLPDVIGVTVRGQPAWLQFLEILLISDFAFYWAHRMTHAIPALWRLHEVHHSSEKLDWLAGHRVHPLDQLVNAAIIATPGVLLGFSPGPLLAYALIYRWHAVFLHANVRVDFGPLRWIVASPNYHQWHHADQREAYDRNFGGQLVVFDWLFGTLNMPAGRLPAKIGLPAPIARDWLGQMLHPVRRRPAEAPAPLAAAPTRWGS
ncbi:MAG: sterol desaturase family protein [Phenylobacterium sp.]